MAVSAGEARTLLESMEMEAQRALKERPSLSIRTRISLGFLLWFLLSLGITIASFVTLNRIQSKLLFMEGASNYTFEIQQARRFEKNYFLYGTNLSDALEHVRQAQNILTTEGDNMAAVVGVSHYQTMVRHLERYRELLIRLQDLDREHPGAKPGQNQTIEVELRRHGAEMVAVAEELVSGQRQAVNTMLLMAQRIPIIFLFVLLLLMIYLANFLTRQMLRRLNWLMEATRRIADGDLTPITPRRRYRDEFSELAMAMNHMMYQLAQRNELLVRAHKLKAVGTLTAGVAHELNNPINNIMLTISMILEDYKGLSDEDRLEMLRDIMGQTERCDKIVRNLLDFARESELKTQLFQIKDIINETVQLASNQIKLSKVKVRIDFAPNLPPIRGDRQQLAQVFLNLVLNALDAMPEGGNLSISTGHAKEENCLKVEFTDTGLGIPEHILPNIFDPFFTTKSIGKGTGLGLSVSLGIIRKHGGDVHVKSSVNQGSTFEVLLPIAQIPAKVSGDM